jgi:hypothetical protein
MNAVRPKILDRKKKNERINNEYNNNNNYRYRINFKYVKSVQNINNIDIETPIRLVNEENDNKNEDEVRN